MFPGGPVTAGDVIAGNRALAGSIDLSLFQ
jgi:hypothetical protein